MAFHRHLTFRRLDSLSPAILDMISGPLMRKKKAPVSLATARAMSVFPDPGGPYSSTPLSSQSRTDQQPHKALALRPIMPPSEDSDGMFIPGGMSSRATDLGGLTPRVLKSVGWRRGSSIISRICAIWRRHPPMSSYPTSSRRSSS
jgi:hypothetical protein